MTRLGLPTPYTAIPVPLSANWPAADAAGVPVGDLISSIKHAIKLANISATDPDRDLTVASVFLKLNTVATCSAGGSLDFRVPFIGMQLKIGGSVKRQHTHAIEMTLIPQTAAPIFETRDTPVEVIIVEAVETVRAVMTRAAEGDDPFILQDTLIELSFGVTEDGNISLGIDGELANEITHTMRLTIAKPGTHAKSSSREP